MNDFQVNITPVIQQYLNVKEEYKDCVVLFRMGDFYEMFFEDAVEGSKLLDIVLTCRDKDSKNPVPMAGVPVHSVSNYIQKLVFAGKKVAICDQVEDAKFAKGLVRREVVQVITPGIQVHTEWLDEKTSHFLTAIFTMNNKFGLSIIDATTGDFLGTSISEIETLVEEIARLEPKEILLPLEEKENFSFLIKRFPKVFINYIPSIDFIPVESPLLPENLDTVIKSSASAIITYIGKIQKGLKKNLKSFHYYSINEYMLLDDACRRNLELFQTILTGERKGSLLGVIDMTITSMGARLLRENLGRPLMSKDAIEKRLCIVEFFFKNTILRNEIREVLKNIKDIERILSRLASGIGNARDVLQISNSLKNTKKLWEILSKTEDESIKELKENLNPLTNLSEEIDKTIVDNPPLTIKEGGIIKEGVLPELDELINISREGKNWFLKFEAEEKEKTQISTLKVRYNKVFGYYIEISKSYLKKVPLHYQRKQTLVNTERFFTEELKKYENLVLSAEEKRAGLEYEIFNALREKILSFSKEIQKTSSCIAKIDFFTALSELAHKKGYCKPEITNSDILEIKEGRHPVVEEMIEEGCFVPNDIYLNGDEQRILLITGPNMAGKSTIIRQTALNVLLAQMGSFVPAKGVKTPIFDRIFTRIGAVDDLSAGRSTFLVEMNETAEILKNATPKSLILLDEIGRGTSTFDGLSIAWATVEYIHDKIKAKTLFATHYHELTEITKTHSGVKNYHVAVKEWNDEIIFLRRLMKGSINRSYGIQVARIAGIPQQLIERAKCILSNLEKEQLDEVLVPKISRKKGDKTALSGQLSLFSETKKSETKIWEMLKKVSLDEMAPIEALNFLYQLKKEIKENE